MLQQIREKFTGWIALVILGMIGISFVFFGVSTDFTSSGFAAKVDGSEISINQFEVTYRQQLERNPNWSQLPDEYRAQIRGQILDGLVRQRLVELYLAESGYQISDELVTSTIQRVPDFQLDGVFDRDTYYDILLQNGYEPARFEASQRRAMREDQLQRALGGTAVVTPSEYRRYLNLIAEQRLVSLATFDVASVAAVVHVSDEMVTTFYDENETLYLTPESADVEFIELRRDVVAESIEISEEAINDYYLESQDRYLQDEQRRARHILILADDDENAAEATAAELLARVQAGESFEELAVLHSKDGGTAQNGGDLGALTLTQLPGELGAAIFAMNVGDIDGPVKSDFGFHVVRLDEILAQGPLPLDRVRGELLTELREQEAEGAFRELQRRVSDALFDSEDLPSIAAAVGLEIHTTAAFARTGGEPFGSNQAAIDAVFSDRVLIDGDISDVIELDASRSAIFKVGKHYEASRLTLDEVREQVAAEIRIQEAKRIVFERSGELLQALESGEDFGVAAEVAGATVAAPRLVARQEADLDQALVFQVFMADKPSQDAAVTGQVENAAGGYTVFSLEAVLPGRPQSIPQAERDAGKLKLVQQAGGADYVAFVQSLYDDAEIVINEDLLAGSDLLQ